MIAPLLLAAVVLTAAEPSRPQGAGLYGVWISAERGASIDRLLPYLRGGQAVADWSEVEREDGRYDFSRLDEALAQQARQQRFCTIQINASGHPDYLYRRVPVLGKFVAGPVRANPRGQLQYWHPDYVAAYDRLLRAFAAHFKASPHRAWILGVRLNWNALSTEHTDVPPEFRQPSVWLSPPGAKPHPVPYSQTVRDEYQGRILATYLEAFPPEIRIFSRNNALASEHLTPLLRYQKWNRERSACFTPRRRWSRAEREASVNTKRFSTIAVTESRFATPNPGPTRKAITVAKRIRAGARPRSGTTGCCWRTFIAA